mmetsp:Transcript_24616/g.76028  ORF Transcript_24616/g.76028 Transcript_24616/m.76028 type:complete len:383 (+) Transcript_24616:1055-2203(+)
MVRRGPCAHGRHPRGCTDGGRDPPEVAHSHGGQRPLRGLRPGARAPRFQGGLRVHGRPGLLPAREAVPARQQDLPGRRRHAGEPHRLQPRRRACVAGRQDGEGGAHAGEPPVPRERAAGLPVLHGVAEQPAGPAPRAGGAAGLAARDRRRHRAADLLRPRRRQRALHPHAGPHQHPGHARPELGQPAEEEERREEACDLPLPVPPGQGQCRHCRVPGRLRQHLLHAPEDEAGGLHHRGPAGGRRGPAEVHPAGSRGVLQHGRSQRGVPHERERVPGALPLRQRPGGELGPAAGHAEHRQPQPPHLRQEVRQRLPGRAAHLRLRGRPHAAALRQVRVPAPRLRGLLHVPGVCAEGRRDPALRHARLAGVHARQAGRHVRLLLP